MEYKKDPINVRHILSGPIYLIMVIPLVILDVFIFIYVNTVFPLLRIKRVPRRKYIRVDRHRLSYLNGFDKLSCAYCGYANGLIHYTQIIAANTEKYWCGIKHKKGGGFTPPAHHKEFISYKDKRGYEAFRESRG